jgi:hypothetical protein
MEPASNEQCVGRVKHGEKHHSSRWAGHVGRKAEGPNRDHPAAMALLFSSLPKCIRDQQGDIGAVLVAPDTLLSRVRRSRRWVLPAMHSGILHRRLSSGIG